MHYFPTSPVKSHKFLNWLDSLYSQSILLITLVYKTVCFLLNGSIKSHSIPIKAWYLPDKSHWIPWCFHECMNQTLSNHHIHRPNMWDPIDPMPPCRLRLAQGFLSKAAAVERLCILLIHFQCLGAVHDHWLVGLQFWRRPCLQWKTWVNHMSVQNNAIWKQVLHVVKNLIRFDTKHCYSSCIFILH